jgi:hypothetical protein
MKSLVSFSRAPGFAPIAKEVFLSTPIKAIPFNQIPAYVIPEVITQEQEQDTLKYMGLLFDRLPFVEGHVDKLIHHYKEFYRSCGQILDEKQGLPELDDIKAGQDMQQAKGNIRDVIRNCKALAQTFIPNIPVVDRVHFLQLHTSGFIRAHVDESRNSSGCVAGVTLGTARVMTLTHPNYPGAKIDMLLAPRSMYVIAGTARTEWEHSVDWEQDDDEHLMRAALETDEHGAPKGVRSDTDYTQPVMFEGKPSGFFRGTRNALIFRGVSPMDLFIHKVKQNQGTKQ